MKPNKYLYWIFTLWFTLALAVSGVTYLMALPAVVDGLRHLGYPIYLLNFLGVAKLLGALAILTGRSRVLKEWAYAGFAFDLLGAFYSHLSSGDGWKMASFPLLALAIMFVSYAQWKAREAASPAVNSGSA